MNFFESSIISCTSNPFFETLINASEHRYIPDNQEVFLSRSYPNTGLIVEILEHLTESSIEYYIIFLIFSFHWNELGLCDTFSREEEDSLIVINSLISIIIGVSQDSVCALALFTLEDKRADILFTLTIDKNDNECNSLKEIIIELMSGLQIKKDIFGS